MKIHNCCFLMLSFFSTLVYGQDKNSSELQSKNLNFHLLDVSSGLSHNFVNDIDQDSLGFIWVATYDGLNRYDGKTFVQFKKHLEEPDEGLANNYVQEIEIIGDSLLLATDAGMNSLNLRTGKFSLFNNSNGFYNNSVSGLEPLKNDQLLVSTYRGGVQVANSKMELTGLSDYLNNSENLSSNEISSMVIQDSVLWIGSFDGGLNRVSLASGKISKWNPNNKDRDISEVINSLYSDSGDNLWIGTREGLMVLTASGEVFQLGESATAASGLSDDEVLAFQEDQNGNMWIGTRNGGLNILNIQKFLEDETLQIQWYLPRNDGKSVFNRTVSVIFQDRDNNMWLGSPTGVTFVNPSGEQISLITKENTLQNSIGHNRIGSLGKAGGNRIWIGTDGGGLDLYSPDKGVIRHFQNQSGNGNSLSNDYLLSILQESEDAVWVGTYQGGLNLLNPKTGKVKHYLQGLVGDGSDVRCLFKSKSGILWVGTNRGGLYRYDSKKDAFQYVESLDKIDIRDIDEDNNGKLWLATYGSGLISYDPENDTNFNFLQSNLKGLNSDVVFSILVLPDGDILAGTRYGGLLRFNPKTRKVQNFTEANGLSNNTINSLILQDTNYVWMGSYNGLNRYNLQNNKILNISSMDNIQEGEFNIGAAEMTNDGLLFFGGNNGLNIFDPSAFSEKEIQYPLVFEGLKVLNEDVKVDPGSKNTILNESLFYQDVIRLAHDQNSFSIDFAALKFPEARNISYSYKLENYNDFWIENQTSGTANFTSVPPGEYNFVVKSSTGFGEESFRNLKITIVPPFWKTVPAYVLYVIILGTLIWLGSRYYSERVKLRNSLIFEKKQRSLEHNLNEERFRFFTAFSHELKTPLTLILAPVENLLSKNPNKENRKDLVFIHRNAQNLFRSINKLLEFRKAEEGLSQLKKEPVDLPDRLRKWVRNYIPLAKEKNIRLEYSGPVSSKIFVVDIEKIEVIFNNLLSNAIKYSGSGGEVKLSFISDQNGFSISVQDSGYGIKTADLDHIFDWYYRSETTTKKSGTGIGLALSKRFAELHKGTIEVKSEEGVGTIFTLNVPITETELKAESVQSTEEELILEEETLQDQRASLSAEKDRKLVLIIDDNEEILNFLNRIFKEEYDVIYATNGQQGIEKAKKFVPDIIISDVMMPIKTGLDLCSELKNHRNTSHIPIILLTAKTAVESVSEGYEEGADDYITKPFHPKILKSRVRNLLSSREKLKSYFREGAKTGMEDDDATHGSLDKEKSFLEELDQVILKHIQKNSDGVEKIAHDVGMSRTSLYRKLKAITGLSINEYIRNFKLERAADLIRNENYSVSQASYEVGFSDVKYFRKVFKEKLGKNPSEFKN